MKTAVNIVMVALFVVIVGLVVALSVLQLAEYVELKCFASSDIASVWCS
jgi:hypothetical protein